MEKLSDADRALLQAAQDRARARMSSTGMQMGSIAKDDPLAASA